MHGGLFSEDDVRLDDIRKLDRNRQPPDTGFYVPDILHMNIVVYSTERPIFHVSVPFE